ncbi:hypothetical protein SAMN04488021_11154 [Paracoccus aminovorans]|uniref:Trypsin-like peptidase domain-containing protein n=1 Tax=Paracoccus aminovorans TaxID=34004 RepID=A0A1I2ZXE4_9RHOB|nr:hypothetical protein JCM7685_pAMV3p0481 [Paracoccus aminovorans]SFH42517.1 hypothetical protein SAMN04488021_11154 [Paracoccus aminovorans]
MRKVLKKLSSAALACLVLASAAGARVVGVEDGAGSGLLFHHRGNCFLVLPSHVHGPLRQGVRVAAPGGGEIGTADVVYVAPGGADVSLALVRGGIARDCGDDWSRLPQRLTGRLEVGQMLIVERARQQATEGRRVLLHEMNFRQLRLVPAPGEAPDLFGGTSGAVVFDQKQPVAMVLEAESSDAVWAIRMDEVVTLLSRFMGEMPAAEAAAPPQPGAEAQGKAFQVLSWSAHPLPGSQDPQGMAAGAGAYVAPLAPGEVLTLELRLTDADRLRRVRILSAPGPDTAVPKRIEIITDTSDSVGRRPNRMPARDMSPDGIYDNQVGERYARVLRIRILSTWGGGSPLRIDRIVID